MTNYKDSKANRKQKRCQAIISKETRIEASEEPTQVWIFVNYLNGALLVRLYSLPSRFAIIGYLIFIIVLCVIIYTSFLYTQSSSHQSWY